MATSGADTKILTPAHTAKRVRVKIPAAPGPVHAIDVVVGSPAAWIEGAFVEVVRPLDVPADWQVELIPASGVVLTMLNGTKLKPGEAARVSRKPDGSWEGTIWKQYLSGLKDVDLTTAPSNGQALVWDGAGSKWKAGTISGGGGGTGSFNVIDTANTSPIVIDGWSGQGNTAEFDTSFTDFYVDLTGFKFNGALSDQTLRTLNTVPITTLNAARGLQTRFSIGVPNLAANASASRNLLFSITHQFTYVDAGGVDKGTIIRLDYEGLGETTAITVDGALIASGIPAGTIFSQQQPSVKLSNALDDYATLQLTLDPGNDGGVAGAHTLTLESISSTGTPTVIFTTLVANWIVGTQIDLVAVLFNGSVAADPNTEVFVSTPRVVAFPVPSTSYVIDALNVTPYDNVTISGLRVNPNASGVVLAPALLRFSSEISTGLQATTYPNVISPNQETGVVFGHGLGTIKALNTVYVYTLIPAVHEQLGRPGT